MHRLVVMEKKLHCNLMIDFVFQYGTGCPFICNSSSMTWCSALVAAEATECCACSSCHVALSHAAITMVLYEQSATTIRIMHAFQVM